MMGAYGFGSASPLFHTHTDFSLGPAALESMMIHPPGGAYVAEV